MNPTQDTWITNAILYTQDEKRNVIRANLKISNGRIESISQNLPKRLSKTVQVIDASGLTILPGFIQAHIHLCQTLFRNQADDLELLDWLSKKIWVMEAAHTPETLYTSAALGIYELLSSGTTCILDMGTVRHTDSIFQAVLDSGIRANVGKCLMDHPTRTPPTLRESTEDALKEASFLYDKWNGMENDRIRASFAPRFVLSCTEKLLQDVSKIAKKQNAIIHTHASENQKEVEWVRELFHCENIEYLQKLNLPSPRLVLAHCIWLNSKEKDILQQSGTHVVHCPSSNLKLASGIASIPELKTRHINIALGADGSPCNNNLNILQEMRLAALIHKPGSGPRTLRAMEVIDMATRNGAKALNWFDDIGTIEVGKKADLVALNLQTLTNLVSESQILNPEAIASSIVYSSQPSHIAWSMVDGRILFKNNKVLTLPRNTLLKRVRNAQRSLQK